MSELVGCHKRSVSVYLIFRLIGIPLVERRESLVKIRRNKIVFIQIVLSVKGKQFLSSQTVVEVLYDLLRAPSELAHIGRAVHVDVINDFAFIYNVGNNAFARVVTYSRKHLMIISVRIRLEKRASRQENRQQRYQEYESNNLLFHILLLKSTIYFRLLL